VVSLGPPRGAQSGPRRPVRLPSSEESGAPGAKPGARGAEGLFGGTDPSHEHACIRDRRPDPQPATTGARIEDDSNLSALLGTGESPFSAQHHLVQPSRVRLDRSGARLVFGGVRDCPRDRRGRHVTKRRKPRRLPARPLSTRRTRFRMGFPLAPVQVASRCDREIDHSHRPLPGPTEQRSTGQSGRFLRP
jgi:hypothetical protein